MVHVEPGERELEQRQAGDTEPNPLALFAEELRTLQRASPLTPTETHRSTGVPLSTVYAALAGTRLPSEPVLAALVEAWQGDRRSWITLRRETAAELRTGDAAGPGPDTDGRLPTDLSGHLTALAGKSGVSIRELARRAGVNASTVSRALSGETLPGWEVLRSLATALDLDEPGREALRRLWLSATRTAERPEPAAGGMRNAGQAARHPETAPSRSDPAPQPPGVPAHSPTAAALALANRLRRTRHSLGLTLATASSELALSKSRLSRFERGVGLPSPELLELLADLYRVPAVERDELRRLRTEAEAREWWSEYDGRPTGALSRLLSLEPVAEWMHVYEATVIPGLLQTEPYGTALAERTALHHDESGIASQAALQSRVALRMERQRRFLASDTSSVFLLDESTLHRKVGDAAQMVEQIEHLLRMAEKPGIRIRVVPLEQSLPIAVGSLTRLEFRSPDVPEVLYHEGIRTTEHVFEGDPDYGDFTPYREALFRITTAAANRAASMDILRSARDRFART
ncbi:helix-turn-helix domain-containing protein [Streptomyces sp. CBMA156]|uniref:helix-turn-helix domain-containing protein n=1 Tax=Streptomyces sp. CBMA156 TaxID=1930280 RepID=UPI001661C7F0|nr:helix-turn-helix transcriptional regulator [Streptomyces sp. CBMA156]